MHARRSGLSATRPPTREADSEDMRHKGEAALYPLRVNWHSIEELVLGIRLAPSTVPRVLSTEHAYFTNLGLCMRYSQVSARIARAAVGPADRRRLPEMGEQCGHRRVKIYML